MPESKKVLIELPSDLLNEAENFASKEHCKLDEFIRAAIEHYIESIKDDDLREDMIRGYQEMAEINLKIAEEFIYSDNEALLIYETENKQDNPS